MANDISRWYDFVLQQMASEAYLENVDPTDPVRVRAALIRGNNRIGFPEDKSFTRFATIQADELLSRFQIIHQASDDPTVARNGPVYYAGTNILANSGLSATLIQRRGTNEYTLAIRSTEFRTVTDGGDRDRDVWGADVNGITKTGFALAQLSALEDYFSWLKASGALPAGSILNVTGYSLGGHLATVFTEIHATDVEGMLNKTYTFNGAGRGTWSRNANDPGAIIAYYKAVLADPDLAAVWAVVLPQDDAARIVYDMARALSAAGASYDPISIYNDRRHQWAEYAAQQQFGLSWIGLSDQGSSDLRNGAASRITQLYGKEFPFESTGVANSGVHGPATGVFVEAQPLLEIAPDTPSGATDFGNAHAVVLIADSLAVMRLYQTLDTTATLDLLNRLFSAASNQRIQNGTDSKAEGDPLENMLDALRKLILGPGVERTAYKPGGSGFGNFDFRNAFHNNIDQLTTNAQFIASALEQVRFRDLTVLSAAEVLEAAQGDIAYRYALKDLNPFAVAEATALYDTHNTQGQLDRFDPAGGTPAGMTREYLTDRAAMLAWLMLRNSNNSGDVFAGQVSEPVQFTDLVKRSDDKPTSFRIVPLGSNDSSDLSPDSPRLRRFAFGTDEADLLRGGPASDGLYGGLGTDVLSGKSSNDYLEGSAGLDVYDYTASTSLGVFNSNDGNDTIRDTDGKGVLRYTYTNSSGSTRSTIIADASVNVNATTWQSADGKFTYTKSPNAEGRTDLVVTINGDAGGSLTLKDFRDGDFAIRLRGSVAEPQGPVRTFYGDKQNWDSDPSTPDIDPRDDAFGNYIRADGQDGRDDISLAERADEFFGGTGAEVERFVTAGGNDIVKADGPDTGTTGGADLIDTGAGRDIVWAGPGDDFVEGGADGDVVNAGDGDDALYGFGRIELAAAIRAGETEPATYVSGDFLSGGQGNDRLIGAAGNDALLGGDGEDILVGGPGDDDLWGDLAHGASTLDWAATRSVTLQDGQRLFDIQLSNVLDLPLSQGAADAIYGGAGFDWSFGGGGDDFIDSGSGDDVSFGQAGADILIGGAGNDVLSGDDPRTVSGADEGGDYLDGGSGNDELFGNGGGDVLVGGPGNDTMVGGAGKDIYLYNKGDGTDTVFDTPIGANDPEASLLVLGDGILKGDIKFFPGSLGIDLGPSDPADANSPHDVLHFEGFDQLNPANTPLVGEIHFADGTSMTYADILSQGFDVDGTEEDDDGHDATHPQLAGTGVTDRIRGFAGNDQLYGFAGDDVLDGGSGNDDLQGGDGNDGLLGGSGGDHLFGEAGADTLSGGDDNDALVGDAGSDTLSGDAGVDSLWGGSGDDVLEGGDDNDTLYGNDGADTVDGGAGNDTLYGHTFAIVDGVPLLNPLDDDAADLMRGGDGDDDLNAGGGADTLEGGAGADLLEAEGGDDLLDGGDGADDLQGGDGSDVLTGGTGDDALEGGAGDDFYVFNLGDAHDTIWEQGDTVLDAVIFGSGIAATDLTLWQSGSDLNIGHANGADVLTIANWYAGVQYQISEFRFADGNVWSAAYASAEGEKVKRGTAGADTIFGGAIGEAMYGLGGNDTLYGNQGSDTLVGGTGDDALVGGDGADTYCFELGDGRDLITESGQGNDALIFGAGIAKADIQVSRAGNDLVLAHINGNDKVTIKDWFNDVTRQIEAVTFAGTGESFSHSELTDPFLTLTGTANADFIFGGDAYGETILGLAGNDVLHGGAGNDFITGGLGNDAVYGEGGNDRYFFKSGDGQDVLTDPTGLNVIQFGPNLVDKVNIGSSGFDQLVSFTGTTDSVLVKAGGFFPTLAFELVGTAGADNLLGSEFKDIVSALAGNDSVKGGWGVDEIHGGAGNDTLEGGRDIDELWGDEGDDVLDGGSLSDTLGTEEGYITRFHGGPGNDTLYGNTGADSYYFDPGDGQDTVIDEPVFGNGQWHYSLSDDLIFGPGIASDTIAARASGGDLVVDVSATDRVTLRNWIGDPKYRVEWFRFSDGTSLNETQVSDLLNVRQGTAGNDTLTGTDMAGERLYGRAGNDILSGLGGDDLLDGGTGNDLLDGGPGNDAYVINPGDGADLIRDSGGMDEIRFGAGISAGGVSLERSGNNLLMRLPGAGNTVTVENYLKDPTSWIETLTFADGSSLPDANTIVDQLIAIRGTSGDDNLAGTSFADRLYGAEGSDTLSGSADDDVLNGDAGDDLLAGGGGNDQLAGGPGIDRYQFNSGDGNDTIVDVDAGNMVQFGAGITPQNVITTRASDDLALSISGTADRLSIPGYFVSYPIAEFRFTDGTIWTIDTIKTKVTTGTSGADTLIGFETNDAISGLAGSDAIYGRGGNDTLDGGLGSDSLYGEDGNDTLIAGTGEAKNASVSNRLYGGAGDDVLLAGGNANSGEQLDGGPGHDILLGNAGRDALTDTGYDGGNSLMLGGSGVDTIRMYGSASAIAIGGAGNDTISAGLGTGVTKSRMIVAFNKSDGAESVDQLGAGSTISVGGGTLYSNLSLEVFGSGLRLKTGSSNYVYLSDWYSSASWAGGKSVSTLQIVIEGTRDYKPTSSNPMNNRKIQEFDFAGLVAAFDAARAAGQNFNVANNLANFWLSSSDTDAMGGAVAYQYARTGSLGALTYDQMRSVIRAPEFASAPQSISASAAAAQEASASEPFVASTASVDTFSMSTANPATSEAGTVESMGDEAPRTSGLDRRLAAIVDDWFARADQGQTIALSDFGATEAGLISGKRVAPDALDIAKAWRRVARDLPAHLEDHAESGFDAAAGFSNAVFRAGLVGAASPVVAAVGLSDTGRNHLRPLEGLKEGFSVLA